jgi:hypothetical protein
MKTGGWQNKIGLVVNKTAASIALELKNIESSIHFLTLDSLKSYGAKWANSGSSIQYYNIRPLFLC